MKVPPLNLTPDINRVGMTYSFSPDMLWRYPLTLPQSSSAAPSSPLLDVKNQMPTHLAPDPRMWTREDVSTFLRWFEREFELPSIDLSKFCMNGKALCMLNKTDLADRAPGAGDILHNTLQFLLRDAPQQLLPHSPLTPHHPLMSPTPLTPTPAQPWSVVKPELHNLGQFLQQGGSVTLSPAPSEQSGGSPRHPDNTSTNSGTGFNNNHSSSASTGSGQSDSEDSVRDDSSSSPQRSPLPPSTALNSSFSVQAFASLKHITEYQRAMAAAVHSYQDEIQQTYHAQAHKHLVSQAPQPQPNPPQQQSSPPPLLPSQTQNQSNNGSSDPEPAVETGTNGRLLWDFLQQLLNDSQQRYSRYIAWKNRDTGVFKIVDPPGLAKLWGIQKNHLSMNYDKMSRALRYYYRVNILRKVQGERHCYQFLRNPTELKSIKNISMLRGAPLPSPRVKEDTSNNNTTTTPAAPMEEEEGPTDLSMPAHTHHQRYAPLLQQNTTREHHSPVHYNHQSTTPTIQGNNASMDTQPQNLSVESRMVVKNEEFYAE